MERCHVREDVCRISVSSRTYLGIEGWYRRRQDAEHVDTHAIIYPKRPYYQTGDDFSPTVASKS